MIEPDGDWFKLVDDELSVPDESVPLGTAIELIEEDPTGVTEPPADWDAGAHTEENDNDPNITVTEDDDASESGEAR
jgi:hypothetical protein